MNLGFRMPLLEGYRAVYIGSSVNSEPSDQTDLKEWRRCNLGGGGEPTFEGGADRWGTQASCPIGGKPLVVFLGVVSSRTL